jgi:integrase
LDCLTLGVEAASGAGPLTDPHYAETSVARQVSELGRGGNNLPTAAAKTIAEFARSETGARSPLTVRKHLAWLQILARRMGDEFLTPSDHVRDGFVRAMPENRYSRASREAAWGSFRAFAHWRLRLGQDPLPPHFTLKFRGGPVHPLVPSDMLTREDVSTIADAMLNLRDRAFVWTLFNSARRPGEILRMTVGDVRRCPGEGVLELSIRGEKGSPHTVVPVYEDAVPALLCWLEIHPRRDERGAPLWCGMRGRSVGAPVSYTMMSKAIENAARRAEVTKPINPYAFRHSAITRLVKDPQIAPAIVGHMVGWVPGTRRLRTYSHLSGRDVREALDRRFGIAAGEAAVEEPRSPRHCARCDTTNAADAVFCRTCGGPLSLAATEQLVLARSDAKALKRILQNPEVVEFLARMMATERRESDHHADTSPRSKSRARA